MVSLPQVRRVAVDGDVGEVYVVGHRLVDEFLVFAAGRARPSTVRAYAHDLKTFSPWSARTRSRFARRMCSGSSPPSSGLVSAPRTWRGSLTAARACRRRRCLRCMAIGLDPITAAALRHIIPTRRDRQPGPPRLRQCRLRSLLGSRAQPLGYVRANTVDRSRSRQAALPGPTTSNACHSTGVRGHQEQCRGGRDPGPTVRSIDERREISRPATASGSIGRKARVVRRVLVAANGRHVQRPRCDGRQGERRIRLAQAR